MVEQAAGVTAGGAALGAAPWCVKLFNLNIANIILIGFPQDRGQTTRTQTPAPVESIPRLPALHAACKACKAMSGHGQAARQARAGSCATCAAAAESQTKSSAARGKRKERPGGAGAPPARRPAEKIWLCRLATSHGGTRRTVGKANCCRIATIHTDSLKATASAKTGHSGKACRVWRNDIAPSARWFAASPASLARPLRPLPRNPPRRPVRVAPPPEKKGSVRQG